MKTLLQTVAVFQVGIALANLALPHFMRWKGELGRLPLLVREVFYVHSWFISITVGLFAVLTLRFPQRLADGADPFAVWVAAGIGLFWGVRTVLQVTYYSRSHWRGKVLPTLVHLGCLAVYGGMALTYLTCVCRS